MRARPEWWAGLVVLLLNTMHPHPDTPFEIVATVSDNHLELAARLDGQPLENALFTTVDVNLVNEELHGDAQGHVGWTLGAAGNYSVYVQHMRKQPGEADGKKYDEIREFATINLNWPLTRTAADPAAVSQFEDALAARAMWRHFPGFKARSSADVDGRTFDGRLSVATEGSVQLETVALALPQRVQDS